MPYSPVPNQIILIDVLRHSAKQNNKRNKSLCLHSQRPSLSAYCVSASCTLAGQHLIKGFNNPHNIFVMVHNEHDAFTIILFCTATVQAIKKWEKLQNVCDV